MWVHQYISTPHANLEGKKFKCLYTLNSSFIFHVLVKKFNNIQIFSEIMKFCRGPTHIHITSSTKIHNDIQIIANHLFHPVCIHSLYVWPTLPYLASFKVTSSQ